MVQLFLDGGGFMWPGMIFVYNDLNGTRQEGKIKGYSKHFLMSEELYKKEMLNNKIYNILLQYTLIVNLSI